jgi:hypothetical protein
VSPSLVFVRREHFQSCIEPQYAVEQALEKRGGISSWQIRTPGSSDKERIAGEDAIFDGQAHRVARVARCMHRL